MTGADLVAYCAFRFRDLGHVVVTVPQWLDYLSSALAKILGQARYPFEESVTNLSLAAGATEVSMPESVFAVQTVVDVTDSSNEEPLFPVTSTRAWDDLYTNVDARGRPANYRMRGRTLEVRPIPTVDTTLRVRYNLPPDQVTEGEIPLLPAEYHRDLAEGALELAFSDDGQQDQAGASAARFAAAAGRLRQEMAQSRLGRPVQFARNFPRVP